jgi:hypothetical protein
MIFGIPGEVFWPTAAFGTMIVLVSGCVAVLRMLPRAGSRELPLDRETLDDIHARLGQLEQLQTRVSELEERVDFTERLLAKQREDDRLRLPQG